MLFQHSWLSLAAIGAVSLPYVASFPIADCDESSSKNYTSIFEPCLSSGAQIFYPNQADYNTSVLQRASTWESPTFAVTVKPAMDSDVQCVVSLELGANYYITR
jgi:hypothetical protein